MKFRRERIRNFYLKDTSVENLFLMEYMPEADGNAVKVYLTALMYADREDLSNRQIAVHLGISEEEVLTAWNYWEECGAIRKHYLAPDDRFHYTVEFLNLREGLFDPHVEDIETERMSAEAAARMDDERARELFAEVQEITGRMLGGREPQEILSWLYDDGMAPELISYAYRYCAERIRNVRFPYISAVINNWRDSGIESIEDAERMLAENDQKYHQYSRVMKALGFSRNPTEDEKSKIDSWFDEMGFSIDTVLQACSRTSGISNPNINYVNAVLRNWSREKSGGSSGGASGGNQAAGRNAVSLVNRMYEEARRRNTETREAHRAEVYEKIPEIRPVEDAIRRTNMAFTRNALGGGDRSSAASLEAERRELAGRREALLREAGYPPDYMDMHYDCAKCRDTGILDDGSRCSCFGEKLRKVSEQQ